MPEDDYGAIGPYEALGVSLAYHLGHTLASVNPTVEIGPGTQRVLDGVCADLEAMVRSKANELHLRRKYGGTEHSDVHSCPCWHEACVMVMINLTDRIRFPCSE